jgi:hypothetical protein
VTAVRTRTAQVAVTAAAPVGVLLLVLGALPLPAASGDSPSEPTT